MQLPFELMEYQEEFVFNLHHQEQGFKGGFRAGKSEAAVHKALYLSMIHAGKKGALLSPTYGMTVRNLIPIFKRLNQKYKLGIKGLTGQHPSVLYIKWGGKVSEIHLDISAENHDRLNGITLAWCGFDEADKCKTSTATAAWIQMGSRLSDPVPGYVGIRFATSTPEGFGFMYATFAENLHEDKILYTASMFDNYMLPPSYIQSQKRTLPKHLFRPYCLGEFTNIGKNIVYEEYDRELNYTALTLADMKPHEVLHVGVDFNNNGMSAIGYIIRNHPTQKYRDIQHVIYECIGATNTKALCNRLKEDPRLKGKKLVMYPDPEGKKQLASADNSNHEILQMNGFPVQVMTAAPSVTDRVNSVNGRFCNIDEERNLLINYKECPLTSKAFLQQLYNSAGEPTKRELLIGTSHTHVDGPIDALGYPTFMQYPILSQNSNKVTIVGF